MPKELFETSKELTKEKKDDLFKQLTGFTPIQAKNYLRTNIYFRAEHETYKELNNTTEELEPDSPVNKKR